MHHPAAVITDGVGVPREHPGVAFAPALMALFRLIIVNDRVGGWRELSDM